MSGAVASPDGHSRRRPPVLSLEGGPGGCRQGGSGSSDVGPGPEPDLQRVLSPIPPGPIPTWRNNGRSTSQRELPISTKAVDTSVAALPPESALPMRSGAGPIRVSASLSGPHTTSVRLLGGTSPSRTGVPSQTGGTQRWCHRAHSRHRDASPWWTPHVVHRNAASMVPSAFPDRTRPSYRATPRGLRERGARLARIYWAGGPFPATDEVPPIGPKCAIRRT